MEMHQVRYFLAVARVLNFTRAAEECHVAQPSLTRAIKQLEDELGSELFRRERNLTHLTEFGARMQPHLKQCFDSAAAAKALAIAMRSGAVAPLKVALSVGINLALLAAYFRELATAFPGLELSIVRGTNSEIAELLKKGDIEVAVAGKLGQDWDRLDVWPLFTEGCFLAVHGEHAFAGRGMIKVGDLADQRILACEACEMAAALIEFMRAQDIHCGATHRTTSDDDLVALLDADFGVGVLPASAAVAGRFDLISVEGLALSRTVSVYGVAGRQRSAPATALVRMLRSADWSQYAREELRATA